MIAPAVAERTSLVTAVVLATALTIAIVDGRQAQTPASDIEDLIAQFGNFSLHDVDTTGSPCTLDIQKDLAMGKAGQPLYLLPQTERYWLPNSRGQLEVPHGASIELYCTQAFANGTQEDGGPRNMPARTRSLTLVCLQAKTFVWRGEKHELRHFFCQQPPKFGVERLAERCGSNAEVAAQLYRAGFNISGGRFVETMRICHDDATLRTLYTQHKLLPASVHFQRHVKRLNFSKAGHFGDHNMNFLYTQQNQRVTASGTLEGQPHAAQYFDNSTLFLTRGHLVAKSDLIYASQQRSTFTYFNAAPQWQSFNGGQWAALEDEVRRFVARAQLTVDCYTGTWGTLELSLASGERRQFFLATDANGNGLLPVPRLFYRVIVERRGRRRRGIALVGVNNPHATLAEINDAYVICTDVRVEVPWLRWIRNTNLKKGYIYACAVNDFARAVAGQLPAHLNGLSELLTGS